MGILSFSGCGLTGNLVDWKGDKELDEYATGRQKLLLELQSSIEKSSEDVKKNFGESTNISNNIWFKGVKYEKVWDYVYNKKKPPLTYTEDCVERLYFNQDKVLAVDVL